MMLAHMLDIFFKFKIRGWIGCIYNNIFKSTGAATVLPISDRNLTILLDLSPVLPLLFQLSPSYTRKRIGFSSLFPLPVPGHSSSFLAILTFCRLPLLNCS